ncbi:hypothetical protein CEXT_584721 [Caerostris extrusa]|uniref:Uncharacterized protein n=1 Tax=Caerostris extrusa TaxID=172846 RepID=A0AAV4P1U3_CAEEX|nr:hypothetical protein CEXT_584721 [Caerostris extrusa]
MTSETHGCNCSSSRSDETHTFSQWRVVENGTLGFHLITELLVLRKRKQENVIFQDDIHYSDYVDVKNISKTVLVTSIVY